MEAILLPNRRKFSWKVFLIVLAMVLVTGFLKTPMIISNEYVDQPELWTDIILSVMLSSFILYGLPGGIGFFLACRVGVGLPFIEGWVKKNPCRENSERWP